MPGFDSLFRELQASAEIPETPINPETYSHVIFDWTQPVYYAWVLYGAVSFSVSLYWIQRFYMQNWYGMVSEYSSGNPTGFTNFGLGETINRLVLICMWSTTAFFWVLSNFQTEGMYWWFTVWARFMHYVDVLRLLIVLVFKTIGVFSDTKVDYQTDDGTNLDVGQMSNVSMAQALSGTDWYMESFGLTVSYSLYGDLLGISKWAKREQEKCIKSGFCKTSEEKVEAKASVAVVAEPEPVVAAPEEDMNKEAEIPSEEELNFNDAEEEAAEVDADDEF
jgi:hypothetical protein